MAVKTLSIEKLPQQFRDLVEFHDSLEKIYSFMIKRKMTVTVSKVEKIYRELVQTDKPISIVDNIFDLCTYCPDAYKLRLCDRILPTSSFDLELSFPIFSSATKIHAQKRHSYLLCRLSGLAVKYFVLWLKCADSKLAAKYSNAQQIVKEVNNSSWPPDFHFKDLNNAFETLATSELKELRRRLYSQNLASPEPHLDGGFGLSSTDHSTTNSSNINVQSTSLEDNGGAEGVLDYLKCQPFYKDQIKHVEQVPAREARYGVLAPPAIPSILQQRLQEALGLQQLYLHQAKAIDALRAGKHTVISTSTASGKSVIYNIPVLEAVLQDPSVTALYLFPTKALAQDQLRSLLKVTGDGSLLPVSVAVCDGDTPQCERARIQFPAEIGAPNIILTNPDMLHCTMLPDHRLWKRIYENIRFVVIDEAHLYRGAFGSHVAAVLRRLLRVCLYYGRCPQFLCCSATIANPAEHMRKLVPLHALFRTTAAPSLSSPVQTMPPPPCSPVAAGSNLDQQPERAQEQNPEHLAVVSADSDGAPQGERLFVVWNPPLQQSQLQQQQGSSSSDKELNTNGGVNDKRKRSSDDKDMAAWAPKDIAAAFLRKPGSGTMAQFVEELAAVDADADADALGHRTAISSPPVAGAPVGRNGAEEVSVPGRASASMQMLMLSPKKQRFLRACEETRPATMGLARDTRIDDPALQLQLRTALPPAAFMSIHFERKTDAGWSVAAAEPVPTPTVLAASNREYEVRYVGGWKRGRSVAQASSTAPSSIGSTDLFAESGEEDFARASSYFPAESERSDGPIAVPQVRRLSSIFETSNIFCTLVKKHLRTLAFCKVRKLVELVLGYSLRNLETSGAGHLTSSLASYRGGYTKEERRAVESDLFSGRLLGVTATCALELGIDVGALDATLHMGFPGTFASLWQQAGRAGRSGRPSLSIMVCFESPVDQYFARHPQVLFGSPVEPALLDVNNAHILYSHLLCAAEEVPLNYKFSVRSSREPADPGRPVTDLDIWGDRYSELLQYLVEANKICLNSSNGSSRYAMNATRNQPAEDKVESFLSTEWRAPLKSSSSSGKSRASSVSLRMIDPVTISILDDSRGGLVIDSLGYSRAFFELFEGAIYMHRAVQYRVLRLDLAAAVAHTQPVKVRYYTSAQNKTEVNVLKVLEQDGIMSSGAVQVVQTVYGYVKHWLGSGEPFEKGECSLPPLEYETCAFWVDLPVHVKRSLEAERLCPISSIHAANHALLAVSPLFAQCDATDLGTEHSIAHSALEQTFRLMIYDVSVGGLGASSTVFQSGREVLKRALELIVDCGCEYAAGCPCCTLQARCTHYNQDLSRRGAARLLELVLALLPPSTTNTSNSNSNQQQQQEQEQVSSADGGGFLRSYFNSPPAAGTDYCGGSTSTGRAALRYSGPVGAAPVPVFSSATSTIATATATATASNGGVDPSPRKARRQKSLKAAFYRDRAHQMAIQMNWTAAVPSFYQESDMS